MLDEDKLTHGFKIDAGAHQHALDHMLRKMNGEQVRQMVHVAKGGEPAHFMVTGDHAGNYILKSHDGNLTIHAAHHN